MKKITSALIVISILLSSLVLVLPAYAEKTELNVNWNTGYAVISIHNPYNLVEGYAESANYSTTDVITVPKKGTKITWTDPSGFAPCSVLTVSNWMQRDGEWVLDADAPLFVGAKGAKNNIIETKNSSGSVTYTYITDKDNENIRICVNGNNENIKVYAEETSAESSWSRAQKLYYAEPPAPVSAITGAPVNATVLENVKWYYGYVGSTSHSSSANKISKGSDVYLYSDVITVPKAGTTVYFYDDNCSDGQASSNAAVFSHWKKSGSDWAIDTSKSSIDGSKATRTIVGDYFLYSYTTEEDNANLRLCYRAALNDLSLSIHPYKVYLAQSSSLEPVTQTGKMTDASFTGSAGNKQNYKIFLPEGFADKKACKVIFNIGASTAITDALLKENSDIAVISFNGSIDSAKELVETAITSYKLNREFLYLIGSSDIKNAFGDIFVNFCDINTSTPPLEAGKALISVAPFYSSSLEGLTMYAMGDSYFAGDSIGKDNTWVNMLGNKYGMDFINYGIGGSTISTFVTTNNPMALRIRSMEKGDADIILLEGGRNDFNKLVPFGDEDSIDTKTFNGALNSMLNYLRKTYPNALIILVTPWKYTGTNTNGDTNVTYADAMRKIAENRNDPHIVCLYAADPDITGVDMTKAAFRAKYCIKPGDVSHLNIEGMKLVFPNMEKFIADAYASFLAVTNPAPETTPEITEPATPDTSSGPAVDETSAEITDQPAQGGCGSFASGALLVSLICGACLVFSRKK